MSFAPGTSARNITPPGPGTRFFRSGEVGGWPCFSWLAFSIRFKTMSPGKKENSRNGSFPLSSFWKLFIKCPKLLINSETIYKMSETIYKQPSQQISILLRPLMFPIAGACSSRTAAKFWGLFRIGPWTSIFKPFWNLATDLVNAREVESVGIQLDGWMGWWALAFPWVRVVAFY